MELPSGCKPRRIRGIMAPRAFVGGLAGALAEALAGALAGALAVALAGAPAQAWRLQAPMATLRQRPLNGVTRIPTSELKAEEKKAARAEPESPP